MEALGARAQLLGGLFLDLLLLRRLGLRFLEWLFLENFYLFIVILGGLGIIGGVGAILVLD